MQQSDLSSAQLRAVLAVAEHRSFIAAAASLHMSQPALTRTIKRVEQTVGVELFSRTTRQVVITTAGSEFAAMAERLLNDLSLSVENLRRLKADQRGQVIVSSVLPLTDGAIAGLLADYSRRNPGVEIHLRQGLQNQVEDDVRSGAADFALGYVDDLPDTIVYERLRREPFYAVFPKDYPVAARRIMDFRSLKGETLVSFPPESRTRRIIDGAAATSGFTLRYAITVNQRLTLLELVRHGAGITVLPASDCPAASDRSLVARLLVGRRLSCQVGTMYLRARELSASANGLLSVMKRWLMERHRPPRHHARVRRPRRPRAMDV